MVIVVPARDERTAAIWEAVVELSRLQPLGWTLIGAQMVALHGYERGLHPPRASLDADILVDVRLLQDGTQRLSRALMQAGYELAGMSPDGVGHRFRSDRVSVDVLAPDGLGPRSNLTTVPPARTVSVPGGTQALRRTEHIDVRIGETTGRVPRPNLLGAILLKARAIDIDDVPDAQRQDLAFLLCLVSDPRAMAAELAGRERTWLQTRRDLSNRGCAAWRGLANADDGYLALRLLAGR